MSFPSEYTFVDMHTRMAHIHWIHAIAVIDQHYYLQLHTTAQLIHQHSQARHIPSLTNWLNIFQGTTTPAAKNYLQIWKSRFTGSLRLAKFISRCRFWRVWRGPTSTIPCALSIWMIFCKEVTRTKQVQWICPCVCIVRPMRELAIFTQQETDLTGRLTVPMIISIIYERAHSGALKILALSNIDIRISDTFG